MRARMKAIFISIVSVGLVVCACFSGQAELIDKISAILDEDLILFSEVHEASEQPAVQVCAALHNSSSEFQTALGYLIERHLLRREIHYLAFPKEQEEVKALALRYLIDTYYAGDAQAFEKSRQKSTLSEEELEEELLLYMKGMDYIRRKYRFNADISDAQVVLNLFRKWLDDLRAHTRIQIVE